MEVSPAATRFVRLDRQDTTPVAVCMHPSPNESLGLKTPLIAFRTKDSPGIATTSPLESQSMPVSLCMPALRGHCVPVVVVGLVENFWLD